MYVALHEVDALWSNVSEKNAERNQGTNSAFSTISKQVAYSLWARFLSS